MYDLVIKIFCFCLLLELKDEAMFNKFVIILILNLVMCVFRLDDIRKFVCWFFGLILIMLKFFIEEF